MKPVFKQLLTITSLLSLMPLSWWGCWIDNSDYEFGADIHNLVIQQITSENRQQEDLHFLEKEAVEPPLAADEN